MARAWVTALSCLAVTAAGLSGCSVDTTASTPSVSKDALQKDISHKLTTAGATSRSVTCADDLTGEVGKATSCDADLGPANGIRVNVKVTAVSGATVSYDTTPSQTQAQLDDSVKATLGRAGTKNVESVSCESGLDGVVGAIAYCNVTAGGTTSRQMVRVDRLEGLVMNYVLVPHLAKADVEDSLLNKLQQQLGKRPNVASCAGDLEGLPDATVDCDVLVDGEPRSFTLTVTSVDGSTIDYRAAPKQ
jgi:uncharacterized protein DUF4333